MKTRGFTLIELLTVIAIIGILAAILIPVVGSVRKKARSAQCGSNLRQIHTAMNLYANDNKDLIVKSIVASVLWVDELLPYMPGGKHGPDGTRPIPQFACPDSSLVTYGGARSDYAKNAVVNATGVQGAVARLAQIKQPTRVIFAGDGDRGNGNCIRELDSGMGPTTWGLALRHSDRANVVYFDGHVASVTHSPDIITAWNALPWMDK